MYRDMMIPSQVMKFNVQRRDPPKPVVQTRVPINSFTTTTSQRPAKTPKPFIYSRIPSGVIRLPLREQEKPGQPLIFSVVFISFQMILFVLCDLIRS